MPWPSIDAGKLRHLLIFYSQAPANPVAYDAGGPKTSTTEVGRAYASSDPNDAGDVIRGGQTVSEESIPLTMRYQSWVKPSLIVTNTTNGSSYVIRGVINHEDRGVLLTLKCVAYGANQ